MSSKLKVNNIIPSTGTQIGISTTGGGINLLTGTVVTGVITATSFSGAVTGTASGNPTLANGSNNRVITATSSSALTGEGNFTFDGTVADITGKLRIDISSSGGAGSGNAEGIFLRNTSENDNNAVSIFGGADDYNTAASAINFINVDHSANYGDISFDTRGGGGYGERLRIASNGEITQTAASGNTVITLKRSNTNTVGTVGGINFAALDGHSVASIQARGDGNDEGAHIQFYTTSAAAGDMYNAANIERLRITSAGKVGIGTINPSGSLGVWDASGSDPTMSLHHSNADVEGEIIRIGRTDIPTIRYHSIKARHGGAATANFIKFHLHNGSSTTSQSEILRLEGDGDVTIPDGDLIIGTSGHGITALGANSSTYGELKVEVSASDFSGSNNVATFKRGSNGAINLAFPSGGGIDFSATSDGPSGVNELLDDYEEGSWTPAVTAGYSAISYHNPRIGYYTRVGNHVSFQIYLYVYQATGAAAEINISLPFTSANNSGRETGAYTCYTNGFFSNSSGDKAHCTYLIGQNYSYLRPCKSTNGAVIYGNDTYLGTGANNRYLVIAGQMFV